MESPVSVSRRSLSPSELSDRPRLSPALPRSFDPNDAQVRERQRTMDVDMAMQLSRARRDTLHASPVATFSSPQSIPADDQPQPDFELLADPAAHHTPDPASVPPLLLSRLNRSEPSILAPNNDDPQTSNFGLPTYQANVSQSAFDFARMEEFAAEEKVKLGLGSPANTRFSPAAIPRRRLTVVDKHPPAEPESEPVASGSNALASPPNGHASAGADAPPADDDQAPPPPPRRHRKISQSNAHPRSHRKGIGGKMALFESANPDTPSSFSARLGLVLGQNPSIPRGPSYDHIAGIPPTAGLSGGILNTGHDRPYRFSFYSNALSATIHARSLSELPAEGQTFEQLFAGLQQQQRPNPDSKDAPPKAFSPPYQETPKPGNQHLGAEASSYFASANPGTGALMNGVGPPGGVGNDTDINTWWLDVQSPTDEEMKMLSKVRISPRAVPARRAHPLRRCSPSTRSRPRTSSWRRRARRSSSSGTTTSCASARSTRTRTARPTSSR